MARILVADDNSNIQKMVGLALKDQGIDVVAVGNGEAAVRKISDLRPDLVLADVFMPVRNGYEVCRYVKEDSTLSHIPVILLVGAFDPLDEQEAQRAGADGVLKKPFVPPDPLISMVKSALMRAGVPLGNEKTEQKREAEPLRSAAELMKPGAGSKLQAQVPENLPEAEPESPQEFTTVPPQLKIAGGEDPIAFRNLLEPREEEEFAVKSPVSLGEERNWAETSGEGEEEDEESSRRGGWRPAGIEEEDLERVAGGPSLATPDWRDAAFHGSSPAKLPSFGGWPASDKSLEAAEAAEVPTVAVGTLEEKPVEPPLPFTGDDWARTVAKGIEEKFAEVKGDATAPEPGLADRARPDTAATASEAVSVEAAQVVAPLEPEPEAEPDAKLGAPEMFWDSEARRASLLAATWDAQALEKSPDETQDFLPPAKVPLSPETPEATSTPLVEERQDQPIAGTNEPTEQDERTPAPVLEESQNELMAAKMEPTDQGEARCWEHAWEAPAEQAVAGALPEEVPELPQPAPQEPELVQEPEPAPPVSVYVGASLVAEDELPVTTATPAEGELKQPDMDELVARVLGKMNPEVLQKVTREILKPVIEAIVRDELSSKKP